MMPHKTKKHSKYVVLGPWYFKVRIFFTLFCLAAIIILVYLGVWQLDRAMQKEFLLKQMQEKVNGIPVNLSTIPNPHLAKNRFTPVLLYGTYLNKYTFLLDNQVLNQKVGYRLLTAFQSPYLNKLVLIDRGWIAQGRTRAKLPEIKEIYGVQELTGIINIIPTGIVLHSDEINANTSWPIVIQSLDFAFIAKALQHEVYDFVVQLPQSADPAAPIVPPVDFGLPADKHLIYACQWFLFAILVVIYYIIMTFKRADD